MQRRIEEEERLAEQQQQEYAEAEERRLDAMEEALKRGEQLEDESNGYDRYNLYHEFERIPGIASWLARGYRSQLDVLADNVRLDVMSFADTVDVFRKNFQMRYAKELARLSESDLKHFSTSPDSDELRDVVRRPYVFRKQYAEQIERFVLLYDGEGLGKLLNMVPGAPVGNDIPDNSLLQDAMPNPASAASTISYVLPEASAATAINLYNASGELLQELNEGARPAGHHEAVINVAKLPSGWYLVRLAVTLPSGDRVSTHAIQVVH
jgi:hypothetical protein